MKAVDTLRAIEAYGASARVEGEHLQIRHASVLPQGLRDDVLRDKEEIVQYLISSRHLSFEEVFRLDSTRDPRWEDRWEDTHQVNWLLTRLYDERGGPPDQLFGAIHYLRCMGARVESSEAGGRLVLGDCPADEYAAIRQTVLVPHAAVLQELFERLPQRSWFVPTHPVN
jgi:hypothetical protein